MRAISSAATVVDVDGVREAVAAGTIGQTLIDAALVAALRPVSARPAPSGGRQWSDGEIEELVFDAVARVGTDGIVLAANQAANDAQFIVWLGRVIRTELNLRARRTPVGRVIRAADAALLEDPQRFETRQGHWALVGDERPPCWTEGNAELVYIAWTIDTKTVTVSAAATKTPPMAYRNDIREVVKVVLKHAGPLTKHQLAEVLSDRFNAGFVERLGYLGEDENRSEFTDDRFEPNEGDRVDGEVAARWMMTQLTEEERWVFLAYLEAPSVRSIGEKLGCAKDKAGILVRRLHEKLRRLADLTNEGELAVECLLDLVGRQTQLGHSFSKDATNDD